MFNRIGINVMGYKQLVNFINKGNTDYQIDTDNIDQFKNSIVICDEIHRAYTNEFNTYGYVINLISSYLGKDITMVYMSATPLNYIQSTVCLSNLMSHDKIKYQKIVDF